MTYALVFSVCSPFLYVLYVLAMAGVLRACGVPRSETAKWALRQADRQRFADLIRATRSDADGETGEPGEPAQAAPEHRGRP